MSVQIRADGSERDAEIGYDACAAFKRRIQAPLSNI